MWERELRKIKGIYDNRLRSSQQKSSKMEQALSNQTFQVLYMTQVKTVKTNFHTTLHFSYKRTNDGWNKSSTTPRVIRLREFGKTLCSSSRSKVSGEKLQFPFYWMKC